MLKKLVPLALIFLCACSDSSDEDNTPNNIVIIPSEPEITVDEGTATSIDFIITGAADEYNATLNSTHLYTTTVTKTSNGLSVSFEAEALENNINQNVTLTIDDDTNKQFITLPITLNNTSGDVLIEDLELLATHIEKTITFNEERLAFTAYKNIALYSGKLDTIESIGAQMSLDFIMNDIDLSDCKCSPEDIVDAIAQYNKKQLTETQLQTYFGDIKTQVLNQGREIVNIINPLVEKLELSTIPTNRYYLTNSGFSLFLGNPELGEANESDFVFNDEFAILQDVLINPEHTCNPTQQGIK